MLIQSAFVDLSVSRPNHSAQATAHVSAELYKPSRSPLSSTRCPYPPSPQLQSAPTNITQVQEFNLQVSQRYPPQGPTTSIAATAAPPLLTAYHRPQPDYRHANRISLLHPEYGPGGRRDTSGGTMGQPPPTQSGEQPLKKIRLTDKEVQPLRIDTRPGTYNPQVEAISPTFPEQVSQEDQAFKTTKDELIQQISKVDREILKVEQQIVILKKKQAELEEVANKPSVKSEVEEDSQPKHQSLPQKIYAENRKKAQSAHAQLDSLGPKVQRPLYNQPTDTTVFHENNRRNVMNKKRLLEYFKKKHSNKYARNNQLTGTYSKLMQEWLRKVDKVESSTKRKVKEAKNREFFEKVFPELRKQREDKERFNRVGARVKSEADMEEIMDNLQEQALEDKKMRSYAVIPPILMDPKERRIKYTNNNNFIEDMEPVYKSRQYLNIWTASEKETFKEKYLQHPKNFYQISQALGERKSVSECVQYYYLSKKTENYKQLLRKNKRDKLRERLRSTRNNPQKVNNSANLPVIDNLSTGVTTRLQREQQQRTGGAARTAEASTAAAAAVTADAANSGNSSSPPIPLATTATPSPLNAGGTTTTSTTSSASGTSTSTTTTASGDWTSTNSSTTQVSSSSAQSTTSNTTVSSVISTSAASSLATSSTASTTTTSSSISTSSTTPMDTNTTQNTLKDNKSVVKFNDFNSFEDYNNRKKIFGDSTSSGTVSTGEKEGETNLNAEQKDQEGHFSKDDAENTTGTSEANCDNALSSSVPENKKKKERRKDKENNVETSDEEAASIQDKTMQGVCIVCNAQLGPQLHSRPLQPSQASQYGLREDDVPLNSRVCNTCRCKCVRSRYTHCPLPTCPNARGRVKRLRSFPYRLQDLPAEVRDPILAEFRIPSGVTKCCSVCFNRIQRRLGPVEEWPEEEVTQLKAALTELAANWQLIGERLNKSAHQVRSFYAANQKRLNLENCLGDRKPTLTDEEESGSSTSSCEEPMREQERHSSDTASAAESPPVLQGTSQNAVKKEDYDSSATETADEAQTPDHYQSATITPVANDYQACSAPTPLSVKELVMNVIEISLNKNSGVQQPGQVQGSGMAPTISSILNNDSNEVTIVSEYNLNSIPNRSQPPLQPRADISLTKLANTIGATITPVSGPIRSQPQPEPIQSSRDDLVVVQVPDTRDSIPETLDLSIKKPREPIPPSHPKHPPSNIHRSEPSYIYHQERKSPAYIRTSQVKLPSPQPANPKTGSITLGTPIVNTPTRYDGLLRQIPDAKMGSITKGTPIHTSHSLQDKRVYDYFTKQGRLQSQQNIAPQPQPYHYPQRSAYEQQMSVSSQMSSRQIIMDDYITSQQMHSNRRPEKPHYYPANSPHRTPPPPNQQRQGVIQRHTRPQLQPLPGHEALTSLVDIAVQQPSLPVPTAPHEGLGKTIADNIMEQPHRYQIIQQQMRQQQQQQQRIDEHRRAYHQQQQQQQVRPQPRSDPNTMTAASLIDAIITHQINQTAEGGRGDVVSNSRETRAGDLLFQSFQRDPPVSQENNGVRPPSVISLDLDSDVINKNLTVKELTDTVISHDFSTRPAAYYHLQENVNEQWKRRLHQQQQQKEESKRSATPQQSAPQQDERQIIRIAQPQKYHHEPVSPPENNHWSEQNFRRYQQPQSHMSPLDYVKNRIVEVMRTEDDKKDVQDAHVPEKDRSDSPGEMVIDEEKHDNDFSNQQQQEQQHQQARAAQHPQPLQGAYSYSYVHKDTANDSSRSSEPKPLLSAQYEPLSDED
ncbi:nuclear receptor corepressor smrter isoform X3 [Rhynchophorus ferrugineus]|uniref:nuclear receptor corepressor smrter isoform X3 n=1 Tax=Rhynchophorus ferrugineus TaxID=354439 RepID=UPI003FCD53BA